MKALYIYVGTAGIGRMQFGSWIDNEPFDRSDGDDEGTFPSITSAMLDAARRYERRIVDAAFKGTRFFWPALRPMKVFKKHGNVNVVAVTRQWHVDGEYTAQWMGWDRKTGYYIVKNKETSVGGYARWHCGGDTIVEAVTNLATETQNHHTHASWADRGSYGED